MSESAPSSSALAAFAAAVTIGGVNFLAVRVSNRELPPFWGAGLRFGLAASLFVVIAVVLRLRWPRGRLLATTVLYGLLSFAVSYALMYWALVRVTASMAAVVLALVPLVAVLLAAVHGLERLRPRTVAGALLALAGIVWITVGADELVLPAAGLVAILAAALTIGESVIVGKRISASNPVMTNAVGMLVAAPVLLAISLIAGESWALPRQASVAWSVAYLAVAGSVGLFVLILLVIRRWTVAASSYMFVLFPVVTMLLEAWFLDEPLTVRAVTGALVVMSGVWVGAFSRPASRRRSEAVVAEA